MGANGHARRRYAQWQFHSVPFVRIAYWTTTPLRAMSLSRGNLHIIDKSQEACRLALITQDAGINAFCRRTRDARAAANAHRSMPCLDNMPYRVYL